MHLTDAEYLQILQIRPRHARRMKRAMRNVRRFLGIARAIEVTMVHEAEKIVLASRGGAARASGDGADAAIVPPSTIRTLASFEPHGRMDDQLRALRNPAQNAPLFLTADFSSMDRAALNVERLAEEALANQGRMVLVPRENQVAFAHTHLGVKLLPLPALPLRTGGSSGGGEATAHDDDDEGGSGSSGGPPRGTLPAGWHPMTHYHTGDLRPLTPTHSPYIGNVRERTEAEFSTPAGSWLVSKEHVKLAAHDGQHDQWRQNGSPSSASSSASSPSSRESSVVPATPDDQLLPAVVAATRLGGAFAPVRMMMP